MSTVKMSYQGVKMTQRFFAQYLPTLTVSSLLAFHLSNCIYAIVLANVDCIGVNEDTVTEIFRKLV